MHFISFKNDIHSNYELKKYLALFRFYYSEILITAPKKKKKLLI